MQTSGADAGRESSLKHVHSAAEAWSQAGRWKEGPRARKGQRLEGERKPRREYDPIVVAVAALALLFVRSDGLIVVALILAALFVGYRLSRMNE